MLRRSRLTKLGRSTLGTFQTSAIANWPVWATPWEPHTRPRMPTMSPMALLRRRAWMLWASECPEPEPMTGNWAKAEDSIRCSMDALPPATMPRMVTSSSRSGNSVRNP